MSKLVERHEQVGPFGFLRVHRFHVRRSRQARMSPCNPFLFKCGFLTCGAIPLMNSAMRSKQIQPVARINAADRGLRSFHERSSRSPYERQKNRPREIDQVALSLWAEANLSSTTGRFGSANLTVQE
jgi:hypothetical protein